MESFEQEVKGEQYPATFWEKVEVWTSLPIPDAIRNHMNHESCDCGGDLTPTHWNPVSGLFYSEHDCPEQVE